VIDPPGDAATRSRRIARVITRLNIGGPAIQAIALSRELAAFGFSTLLVHGRLGPAEGDMTTILPVSDLTACHVRTLVRPISPLNDLAALWRLFRLFRQWKPDIVHTHMAKAGTLGRLAAIFHNLSSAGGQRARLVHTYHGHVFEGYFGSVTSRLVMAVERWLGWRTDAVIVISPQIRDDVLTVFRVGRPERTHLIPLGFDLDRFFAIDEGARARARAALSLPPEAVVVATVGRLTAIKQPSLFLEIASALAETNKHVVFLIVGDGELRPALEQQAAAAGLAARARFLGWRSDLEVVYGATDIFVLTSRSEGTPVALIEAMASGVAVVSTDVGGVRDVITEPAVGVCVPSGNHASLVHAVQRLVRLPEERSAMGAAARSAIGQRFDLRRLSADVRQLYEQLLRQG
jgi:glycosyltransferase involved in cell wall biosynthesis